MYMMHMLLLPFLPITALIIQVRFEFDYFDVHSPNYFHLELDYIERPADVPEGGRHYWKQGDKIR